MQSTDKQDFFPQERYKVREHSGRALVQCVEGAGIEPPVLNKAKEEENLLLDTVIQAGHFSCHSEQILAATVD